MREYIFILCLLQLFLSSAGGEQKMKLGLDKLDDKPISQPDTVIFSSEKVGLIVFTKNADSIKILEDQKYLNPFAPTMADFSPRIFIYEKSPLVIKVKDSSETDLVIYVWQSVLPGAYRFDWWQYMTHLSGTYYVETILNNKSKTIKALIIR
jgi:hypothetical protein